MRLIIVGPGRAGGALAIAASQAGHDVVGVLSRSSTHIYGPVVPWDSPLPEADVVLIAVKDDSIASVTERLKSMVENIAVVAHLSGFVPVLSLQPLQERGVAVGGFHPLVSIPDPASGAGALRGAFVGIGGDQLAIDTLTHLGSSLGLESFRLEDTDRPAYHAAAAAAANFVVTSLSISSDLFESAGIDPRVSRPLVERVIANCFDNGPAQSLTGPIARGDVDTVVGHLTAADEVSDSVGQQFHLMVEATAVRAGRERDLHQWK